MAGKGGKRQGAGRKPKAKVEVPQADRGFARKVVDVMTEFGPPIFKVSKETNQATLTNPVPDHVLERIRELWYSGDERIALDTQKYWFDKADGKAVQTVNHLHDKPIEMNVNVSIAETVRKIRERKEAYERSRS